MQATEGELEASDDVRQPGRSAPSVAEAEATRTPQRSHYGSSESGRGIPINREGTIMRRISARAVTTDAFLTFAAMFSLLAFRAPPMTFKPLQTGLAACYNRRLIGHRTTSGQRYDPNALTASHRTIPMGTHVRVTNLENGKSVVVVINDRMSAHGKIIMDISEQACKELQFGSGGEAKVKVEVEPSKSAAASHS